MTPADLAARLDDERPAVQNRAVNTLAKPAGTAAIPALNELLSRSRAAGCAAQRGVGAHAHRQCARPGRRFAARSTIATTVCGTQRSTPWASGAIETRCRELRDALKSAPPALQRAAAEALGRIGDGRAVPDLLAAAASPLDRVLEHSITYALIEINDRAATAPSAQQAATPRARRAALIALDQMDDGALDADAVVTLLDSSDPVLKDTAWWIAGHRPEWGGALAKFFEARLSAPDVSPADRDELQQKLAQFGENPAIQELLAGLVDRADSKDERLVALRAMAAAVVRTRAKVLPASWVAPLVRGLSSPDPEIVTHVLSVIRTLPSPKDVSTTLQGALLQAGRDKSRSIEIRLNALAAIQNGLTVVEPDVFELLRSGLEAGHPVAVNSAAAAVVEKATFNRTQLIALAEALPAAGALELPRLLRPFSGSTDEAVGLAMIASLQRSKSRSSVRADMLRPVLAKYPESVQTQGEALLASFSMDSANQVRRLEALLPSVQGGDVARGQAVFNSAKAACYACHAIGYLGGKIGPDLTRIGQVRSERDLLEAILFPSASFARGYEPVVIRTRSGEVRGGVLRSNDLPDEVVLATDREETRIPRRDIVEMQPGTASLMPPGLDEQLSKQELADLLAFLKATRSGAN